MIEVRKPRDSGNVHVLPSRDGTVIVTIEPDNAAPFKQWFYFEIHVQHRTAVSVDILVDDTSFDGWTGARPFVQIHDGKWHRHAASLENGRLRMMLDLTPGIARVAYFQPYSYEKHRSFIRAISTMRGVSVAPIGRSKEGREIDLVEIRKGRGPVKTIWTTARQHPGEVMGSWWMEGFLSEAIATQRDLDFQLKILAVPMLNPDGVFHGNIRTNAVGVDLNRAWQNAPSESAPEVIAVLSEMRRRRPDVYIDVHGVEDMRHCFFQPPEGPFGLSGQSKSMFEWFEKCVARNSEDLQCEHRFPYSGELSIASNYIAEAFKCLSVTLEMPFQDTSHTAKFNEGWTAERSESLGAAVFRACVEFLADAEADKWIS